MSRVFFPLRSNAAWFSSETARSVLERRLKNYLLLYDELILQDGRYLAKHSARGWFDSYTPAELIDGDRSEITYYSPDDPFVLRVAEGPDGPWHPVFQGPITRSYEVDFLPILKDAGLLHADFVRLWDGDLTAQPRRVAGETAEADTAESGFQSVFPDDPFLRGRILNALYVDSLLAEQMGAAFSVDADAVPIIERKATQVARKWAIDPTGAFQRMWVSIMLPDLGNADWDDVLRARESAAGKDFRLMISRVVDSAADVLPDVQSEQDLITTLNREFSRELVHELIRRRATPADASLNVLLNLIPAGFGSFVSVPKDVLKLVAERRSWVTFLDGIPRGIRVGT